MPGDTKDLVSKYVQAKISDELRKSIEEGPPSEESNSNAYNFHNLQTYNPIFDFIWRSHTNQPGQWLGSKWRIAEYDISESTLEANISDASNSEVKTVKTDCFRKVVHILNPTHIIQDVYRFPKTTGLPWHTVPVREAFNKIQSPFNKAYIDNFGSYLVGRLRETNISPHFSHYYGGLTTLAGKYLYNITDDYDTYKNLPWFWKGIKALNIRFHVLNSNGEPYEDIAAVKEITTEPINVSEDGDEIIDISVDIDSSVNIECIEDADIPEAEADSISTDNSDCTDDDEDEEEEDDNINIYLEFKDMPTMMMFFERQDGSMDDLFYDHEEVGAKPGSKSWNDKWTAWMFQVIAALTQLQETYDMTHNDLHSNNILWKATKEEYIYYKRPDGTKYRVPTYGKIFRIIDYGRAIFKTDKENGEYIMSDDYYMDNEASGQYNFGPVFDPDEDEVLPNPSFDLCRLAVSCIDKIFPQFPKRKKHNPKIMSKEQRKTMWETDNPLFNMMWRWLVTDDSENILFDENNKEKYPDFTLYIVIAREIHGAVPSEQLSLSLFNQ